MRSIIKVFAVTASFGLLGTLVIGDAFVGENKVAVAEIAERPNIIVVMTDDLDKRSMKQLGGINDTMGAKGMTFKNAFVNYSLCCPSRASFLRGQYPHNHGILGLDTGAVPGGEKTFRSLGRDRSTVATWLDDAGYQTKHIGKYLNGYNDLYVPPGWDEWFTLKGAPLTREYVDNGEIVPVKGHSTDVFADKASGFIRRSSANPEPFFVVVDTLAPHGPPEVAERHKANFVDEPLPRPPNFDEPNVLDKPAWLQAYPRFSQKNVDYVRDRYRWRLRSMLSVEDMIDQTISTLREMGELNNTYIIFTSDNGMHLGNHRLMQGKKTPYEEAIGVPLIVRGPGVPTAEVRNQLVTNNDLAPTIADLAGVSTPDFVDGRSFAPLLNASQPSSWRKAYLEEGWLDAGLPGITTPDHQSVRTQRYMFTQYDTGEQELYDLKLDPYQLQSLPRAGHEALYSAMETRLNNLKNCSAGACRTAEWTTDETAPRVTVTTPAPKATWIAPSGNIKATFSEPMMSSTVNGTTFKLFERGSATNVAASVQYSASTRVAILDPVEPLRRGLTYDVRVTTRARDLAGNYLDQDSIRGGSQQKTWSFTTRR